MGFRTLGAGGLSAFIAAFALISFVACVGDDPLPASSSATDAGDGVDAQPGPQDDGGDSGIACTAPLEACGTACVACFTTVDPCTATVIGDRVRLQPTATTCTPKGDIGCPEICAFQRASCVVPALSPGKYIVEVAGENRVGYPPRELVVAANEKGTASSCELPQRGLPPTPIDGSSFSTSCMKDEDCSLVRFGNPCQPCACPNAAIAKPESDAYYATYRAAVSQCPSDQGSIVCAACPLVKAICAIGTGTTGTCKLVNP